MLRALLILGVLFSASLVEAQEEPSLESSFELELKRDFARARRQLGFGWTFGLASVGTSFFGFLGAAFECFDEDDCTTSPVLHAMAYGGIVTAIVSFGFAMGGWVRRHRARQRRVLFDGVALRW